MIKGLPERLKELRIKLGYSQRAVAKQLNVSPAIISGYETGERTPSTENLLALSYLFRCSTDYLLGRESSPANATVNAEGLTPRQIQLLNELIATMRE